jgi:hypothetical protein
VALVVGPFLPQDEMLPERAMLPPEETAVVALVSVL